jgi:hypothetical protein
VAYILAFLAVAALATRHGITAGCGSGCAAGLAVEGARSFSVSVSFSGTPKQINTPVIRGNHKSFRDMHTSFGCLLMNPVSGDFALLGVANAALTTGTSNYSGASHLLWRSWRVHPLLFLGSSGGVAT